MAEAEVFVVTVAAADAELAADALWAAGAAAVEERDDLEAGTVTLVSDVAPAVAGAGWRIERAVLADGLDGWRPHARSWRAGRFVVHPPWIPRTEEGAAGDVVLEIDPGRAFGSGSHPTTRLALEALGGIVPVEGRGVVDVGCGSGVLAVAAARLGAAAVDAFDIDAEAVAATTANAGRNGVGDVVRAATGSLDRASGAYDVVLANIGLGALVELAPAIESALGAGGTVLLTGVLEADAPRLAAAYAGCEPESSASADGWARLVLRRRQ